MCGDSFTMLSMFDTALSLKSESSANALMAQAVELCKRPEAPDLITDDSLILNGF